MPDNMTTACCFEVHPGADHAIVVVSVVVHIGISCFL